MKKVLETIVPVVALVASSAGSLIFLYLVWEWALLPTFQFLKANKWILHTYIWFMGGMFALGLILAIGVVVVGKFRPEKDII